MNEQLVAKCSCSNCETHLEFPIEGAGTIINCPHCGQPTELSLEAPAPARSPDKPSAVELLAGFTGPVPRTRVSIFYQIGLLLVTFMMLLLPLFYLAMVAAAGLGVYLYATHFTFLLSFGHGGARIYIGKLLLYFGPLFAGVVLVFFMIKPLFARRSRQAQPLALNPAVESTLYAFIGRICDLVGAPMPKRIDLDCQLNAAAGFRRGALSLFGHDLVLMIGVPLVAGLSLREFAGVIAHEFGHFTQGFGMRLSYVIRRINGWFARVVYERDSWDLALEQWGMESEDVGVLLLANCARLGVGFSRLLLKLLMFIGHGVGCFLLRQMEYDADSYEIKLAGSAAFESTMKRMVVLNQALPRAYKEMRTTWNLSRRVPDNFPAYLNLHESRIARAVREKIQDTMGLAKTGLFHSHPSDGDRIRRARRAGEPGVFDLDLPASVLFSNFEVISRQITQLHYEEDLGLDINPENLRPVELSASTPQPSA